MLQSNETRYNLVLLVVLGGVAAQTQGLVGHELVGAGVDGSSHGDTAMVASVETNGFGGKLEMGKRRIRYPMSHKSNEYQEDTYPRTTPIEQVIYGQHIVCSTR